MAEKILLIDGYSILHRAYYGIPDLTNSKGLHTNAIYGFLNMMFRMIEVESPDYLAVAFDVHAPTFRHQMFEAYKGTRKPMDAELRQQVEPLKELLRAMNIEIQECPGYEADDLLGTMARLSEEAGLRVSIVSGDRDLLQLASEMTHIVIPKTKKGVTEIEDYDAAAVALKYMVSPKEFVDVKALWGDTSDNIPGVPGIGEKGAGKLIAEYHSIENAYAHVEEIKQNKVREALKEYWEQAVLSKTLATITTEAPICFDYKNCRMDGFYNEASYAMVKDLEFKAMLKRFEGDVVAVQAAVRNPISASVSEIGSEMEYRMEEDRLFLQMEKSYELGAYVIREDGICYGVGLCLLPAAGEPKLLYLKNQEPQICAEDWIGECLTKLAEKATHVAAMDVKLLLHLLNEDFYPNKEKFFDASLAAYLLDPTRSAYPYDEIGSAYGVEGLAAREELFANRSLKKAYKELPENFKEFAAAGAYAALHTEKSLRQALEESGQKSLYEEIEAPLIFTLFAMEKEGICVKPEELSTYSKELGLRIQRLEEEIYQECGEEFNINSPKQLGVILFEKLGLPGGKKTKTGYSTSAEVLEKMAGEFPVVNKILEYRTISKLKSTYADGLTAFIDGQNKIHTTFHQTVTATGRLSSADPNLQNIPIRMEEGRLIRKVFVPREGYTFVDADYSQIELRILAHMSADQNLIAAYRDAKDIHRATASQVFHIPYDEVTDTERRNAKAVNFGIVYGISSFGLSEDLSISKKEAKEYIDAYFASYPGIKNFLDRNVEETRESGLSYTLYGRRRPVPEIKNSNFMVRSFGERVAMNSPIQGTAADIMKIAMNRVYQRLREEYPEAKLLIQVHDEVLVEAPLSQAKEVAALIEAEMEGAADLAVRLEADVHMGMSWYEAK